MKHLRHDWLTKVVVATFCLMLANLSLSAQESTYLYPKVKRLEGQGNGGIWLNLTQDSRDNIMAGYPWKVSQPEYESGTSPVMVRVSDPNSLQNYDYILKVNPTTNQADTSLVDENAHWTLTWYQNGNQVGSYTSQYTIGEGTEEEITGHGIVIAVKNHPFAIHDNKLAQYVEGNGGNIYKNNAEYAQPDLIGACLNYSGNLQWLGGLQDAETSTPDNWIRAGKNVARISWECNSVQNGAACNYLLWRSEDFFNLYTGDYGTARGFMDYYGQFEHIVDGTWAPYVLSSPYDGGPKANYLVKDVILGENPPLLAYFDYQLLHSIPNIASYNQTMTNLYSVDIVLTPDQSKWTRALVLEAGSSDLNSDYTVTQHFNGQTYQNIRHEPKNCPSVDKNGNPDNSGTTGYGWFPGYAINVETGERLNIMFAENSEDEYNHGNDMIFNPTNVYAFQRDNSGNYILDNNGNPIPLSQEEYNTLYSSYVCDHEALGEPLYGGRHYVYVCGSSGNTANTYYRFSDRQRNYNDNNLTISAVGVSHGGTFTGTDGVTYPYYECGVYDEGKWLGEKFKTFVQESGGNVRKSKKMQVFNNVMWTGIPMPAQGQESNWLANDATVSIRVSRPYMFYSSAVGTGPETPVNSNAPTFAFSMDNLSVAQNYDLYEPQYDENAADNRINVNNIDAPVSPSGGDWFFNDIADYHFPKGTDKTSYFCYSFWMGGLDGQDSLHLFAERYKQIGDDTWPGPLSTVDASTDEQTKVKWNRVFKITRQEVLEFMASYQNPDYVIPQHILDWPAHGDTTKGQAWLLAPFTDVDGDDHYDPYHGDYPDFPGDMALFVIVNDNYAQHSESQGAPMGAELHAMVYAYDAPEDSIMNNTIFFNYKIFNRSQNNYHNTYIGLWSDWDLGYAYDDYVGCDVMKNTAYCYNGSDVDGTGQSWAYGNQCPVQTLTVLAGPYLPADGRDNPAYTEGSYCEEFLFSDYELDQFAFNGVGFGDGIVDNERYGMTGFVYHNNNSSVTGDPEVAIEYYNYMRGLWKDYSRMRYGANGHPSNGANGPECRFMFPSLSDPCNWGTGGIDPNPFMFGADGWTEANVGNAPYDRRGLASIGPFNLNAGEMQEVDFCMVTIPHSYAVNRLGFTLDSLRLVNPEYRSQNFITPVVVDANVSICEGESYVYNGEIYNETGLYQVYVPNAAHSNDIADTIYRLHLNVVPYYTLIYADILPGQGYHGNGFAVPAQSTTNPGTYMFTHEVTTVDGCDNMVVLLLDVRIDAGVEDRNPIKNFKIYPNPTSDYVLVETDDDWAGIGLEQVSLYDINGKMLQSQTFNESRKRIDLSGYPAGFYLVKLGNHVGKVIKK